MDHHFLFNILLASISFAVPFKSNTRPTSRRPSTLSAAAVDIAFGTSDFWSLCTNLEDNSSTVLSVLKKRCNDDDGDNDDINLRDSSRDGCSLLHYAVQQGAVELVHWCLESGANPNLPTANYESTPLKWAVNRGFKDIAKLLLEYGADIEARDFFCYNPIHYACLGGFPSLVSGLLGVEEYRSDTSDCTDDELMEDVAKLLSFFSQDEDVNAKDDYTGFTPLHVACSLGRTDVVNALLQLGAASDEPTYEGRTPLFFAAGCGHPAIIHELLDWSANLHASTRTGKSNHHIATPGWTPLHEASEKNQVESMECLLDKGIDINCINAGQETAMMIAAQHGHLKVAQMLVERGADINQADDWRTSPLHASARQNHESLVALIIAYGGKVNSCNNYNETPLHHACWLGRETVARLLMENGANAEAKNKDQQTPMDYAMQRGHSSLVTKMKKWQ